MIAFFIVILIFLVCSAVYYLFFSTSSQIFGQVHYSFRNKGKQIALTFDDGPNEPYTSKLLLVLKRHNVKATFFCCGSCISRHPDTLKKIIEQGHVIGNHSHDHNITHYLRLNTYISEVTKTNEIIYSIAGIKPTLYRSPWLFRTPSLLKAIKSMNMIPVWGTFGSELETFQPSSHTMSDRATKIAKSGQILIFHDGRESRGGDRQNTVDAVDLLIPALKNRGFTFIQVSDNLFTK